MASDAFDVGAWLSLNRRGERVDVAQPVVVGCWSKQGDAYRPGDASGLPRFAAPAPPLDLDGPTPYHAKPGDQPCGVETVLQVADAAALAKADIVTFRNNLNKLFGVPFDPATGWTIDAALLGRTLCLDIVKSGDAAQGQSWSASPADLERFTRWGYVFEALATGAAEADANSEFGVALSARVGPHRLLLGAEVDCYLPDLAAAAAASSTAAGGESGSAAAAGLPPLASFLELKTYRIPKHPGQERTLYRHKHAKWWLQSFLAGVPTLALGGRDDAGRVHRIDLVKTADLPRISAKFNAAFQPNLALQFGSEALNWMLGVAQRLQAGQQPQHQQQAAEAPAAQQQGGQQGQHLRFSYDGASRLLRWEVVAGGDLPARLRACLAALPASDSPLPAASR